jgi:hypothetical protein
MIKGMARKRAHRGSKRRPKRHTKKGRTKGRRGQVVKPKLIHAMNKLKNMGASRRVEEVAAAPDGLIRDMSTALHKARKRNMTLPKGLAKQVKKHAKALRTLSNPRVSIKKKRNLISQKGGGILATIARLIPVVGPVLGSLFDSP